MATRSATMTGTGTSDWVEAFAQCKHCLDIDLDDTVSAITYTIETTHNTTTGQAKTLVQPSDVTTAWSFDDNAAIEVVGNRFYRINISAYTGSGNVVLSLREIELVAG